MDGGKRRAAAPAAAAAATKRRRVEPSSIANKQKRSIVYHKQKLEKGKEKREERGKRRRAAEEAGDAAVPKQVRGSQLCVDGVSPRCNRASERTARARGAVRGSRVRPARERRSSGAHAHTRARSTNPTPLPAPQVVRTLDNTREVDDTVVQPGDEEVMRDEADDEFARYFSGEKAPKIMITTRQVRHARGSTGGNQHT